MGEENSQGRGRKRRRSSPLCACSGPLTPPALSLVVISPPWHYSSLPVSSSDPPGTTAPCQCHHQTPLVLQLPAVVIIRASVATIPAERSSNGRREWWWRWLVDGRLYDVGSGQHVGQERPHMCDQLIAQPVEGACKCEGGGGRLRIMINEAGSRGSTEEGYRI